MSTKTNGVTQPPPNKAGMVTPTSFAGNKVNELFYRFVKLSLKLDNLDVPWDYSEEPHVARRQEILKVHPEIKKLFGNDYTIAVIVVCEVAVQLAMAWLMRDVAWPVIVVLAYVVSATLNHSLGSSIHEIGHNLAFGHKYPLCNRALGMLANLPIFVPMSVTYKKYHADHHRYLGHDTLDVDIPTWVENKLFRHPLTKAFWLLVHPFINAVRPFCKNPCAIWTLEVVNIFVQIAFDAAVYYTLGVRSAGYLLLGTFFGLGFHPLSGHFISEHYLYRHGQATVSYYGPLNFFLFNVGYHNEHHDFPYIPYSRLPMVKKIAPEYYENLPYHTSWVRVLFDFIFDRDLGPHAHGVGYLPSGMTEEEIQQKSSAAAKTPAPVANGNRDNNNKKVS